MHHSLMAAPLLLCKVTDRVKVVTAMMTGRKNRKTECVLQCLSERWEGGAMRETGNGCGFLRF